MDNENLELGYKQIFEATAALLKSKGFKKRGNAFRKTESGNVSIIEFQQSRDNSRDALKFTLNVGVISGELLRRWDCERDISKETVWSAHLRCRIGDFLPESEDRWWTLKTFTDAGTAEAEIHNLLRNGALPFLERHSTDADLLLLWKSGRSPGLTDAQRERNMAELTDALAS